MSLNELLLNKEKPWLNARVYDLLIDGKLKLGNATVPKEDFTATVQGTLVNIPFIIEPQYRYYGGAVILDIPPIEVADSNANASGLIEVAGIPAGLEPLRDYSFTCIGVDGNLSPSICSVRLEKGSKSLIISYGKNVGGVAPSTLTFGNFTKAGNVMGVYTGLALTYLTE